MYNPNEGRLSYKQKILFATGTIGSSCMFTFVSTFFMFFLTQSQNMSGTVIGTFFLIARLWDAFNDPIMGGVVVNTKSKFGKNRLWIIIGTIISSIMILFLFANFNMPIAQKYQYYLTLYIIWGMAFTLVDIPYWSMIPALTKNENERSSISAITQVFSSLSSVIVAALIPIVLVKFWGTEASATGYSVISIFIAVIFLATMLTSAIVTKEKRTRVEKKFSIRTMFFAFKTNDQAMAMFCPIVLLNTAYGLILGFGLYYFSFDFGDVSKQSIFMIIAGIGIAISIFSYSPLAKKIGRKAVFVIACVLNIIGVIFMFLCNQFIHGDIWSLSISAIIAMMGFGWINVARVVMTADVCDYAAKKNGQRMDSLWVSLLSFSGKLGSAVVALITGIVLDLGGFVGKDPKLDIISQKGLMLLRVSMFIVPGILVVLALVSYLKFYRLDNKKLIYRFKEQIRAYPLKEINKKKSNIKGALKNKKV